MSKREFKAHLVGYLGKKLGQLINLLQDVARLFLSSSLRRIVMKSQNNQYQLKTNHCTDNQARFV